MVVRSLGEVGHEVLLYIYFILSNSDFYVGTSDNLRLRINDHLTGNVEATKKYLPCKLICYIAFQSKLKAKQFEKYLKTGSGFAFRNRHLL